MDHMDHMDHRDHRDHRDHKPPVIRGQRINQLSPAAQPSNPTQQLRSAAQLSSSAQQPSPSRIQKKLNWGGTQPIRNSKKWDGLGRFNRLGTLKDNLSLSHWLKDNLSLSHWLKDSLSLSH